MLNPGHASAIRQPALFIAHGGGPCFFMPDPQQLWTGLGNYLRAIPAMLPERPKALLVVTAHWETPGFLFSDGDKPELLYDYYGFPQDTYALTWPAPGSPDLARDASSLLRDAGLSAGTDQERALDHGVFIPMKVAFPDADIPCVAMSLDMSLNPALHLQAGRALAPLRDEGVLIIGSGSSYHNMRGFADPALARGSVDFDKWLEDVLTGNPAGRDAALEGWRDAPGGEISHPREEHLLPLMVVAGTSEKPATLADRQVLGSKVALSSFRFD